MENNSVQSIAPSNSERSPKRLFSVTDYARASNVGRTAIYEAWKRGCGPECIEINGRRRIPHDAQWCSDGTPTNRPARGAAA